MEKQQRTQRKSLRQNTCIQPVLFLFVACSLAVAGVAGAYILSTPPLVAVRVPDETLVSPMFTEQMRTAISFRPEMRPLPTFPPLDTAAPSTSPAYSRTPTPGHAIGLSVADTLTGLSTTALSHTLDDFKELGVTWVRLDFDWSVIQRRNSDTYDWSGLDRVIEALAERDLKVLPILLFTPRWARGGDCSSSSRCPPEDPHAFAHFAAVAAERYAPHGVRVWEIWNEPNIEIFWAPRADPEAYTALLKAAYSAIKEVDPDAVVITGGLSPADTKGSRMAAREYLAAIYGNDGGDYFDAVGFHPYSFPASASYAASWNAWQQMEHTTPSLRSIMIENGDGAKQIWITEYGAPTGGPGKASAAYDPREYTDHVTEERQAALLIDAVTDIRKSPWAGPFFWYSYKDLGTAESTTENFFGLIRADGTHKPAFDALRDLLR